MHATPTQYKIKMAAAKDDFHQLHAVWAQKFVDELSDAGRLTRNYLDVHIYFGETIGVSQAEAEEHMVALCKVVCPQHVYPAEFRVASSFWPHPVPMVEALVNPKDVLATVDTLSRRGARVLVHPHTDDKLQDHVENAIWIGTPLKLDLRVFSVRK